MLLLCKSAEHLPLVEPWHACAPVACGIRRLVGLILASLLWRYLKPRPAQKDESRSEYHEPCCNADYEHRHKHRYALTSYSTTDQVYAMTSDVFTWRAETE